MFPYSQRLMARLLAAGTAWWVWLAWARTPQMAQKLGTTEAEVRALGARDAVSGAALLISRDPRAAIWARVLLDLADTWRFGRGRPDLAAVTGGFAGLGLASLLGRSPR
ncbi:MAG: hypothetical protein ACLGG9_07570 [Thermoleophilia bacterium]|jgi:hypothetical protein